LYKCAYNALEGKTVKSNVKIFYLTESEITKKQKSLGKSNKGLFSSNRVTDPDPDLLVGSGSGKFSPGPDPIGTLAMVSCIDKETIF